MNLGNTIKANIETLGPKITQTSIRLENASFSIFSGSGTLKGFVLGNPAGFQAPWAVKVNSITVKVRASSVLSNKIQVRQVHVQQPEIALEGSLEENNLTTILRNAESAARGSSPLPTPEQQAAGKKVQIDDFLMQGARVQINHAIGSQQPVTVTLPDIRLQNLGQESGGLTPAEIAKTILQITLDHTAQALR